LALAVFLPALSKADVIFSDFGPGNTYDCCNAVGIGFGVIAIWAVPFSVSSANDLNQIDMALSWDSGSNSAIVTLNTDTGGLPGVVIESWTVSNLPAFGTTNNVIQTLNPVSTVTLSSGLYWIVVAQGASDTAVSWNINSLSILGPSFNSTFGGSFLPVGGVLPAFDVLGTPVPEPSSFWLLGAMFIGLLVLWSRPTSTHS
jgi:hypothetical protein